MVYIVKGSLEGIGVRFMRSSIGQHIYSTMTGALHDNLIFGDGCMQTKGPDVVICVVNQ